MPYMHVGRKWLSEAHRAVSDCNAGAAQELLAQLLVPSRRDVLSTLGVWQPVSCCDCEHYVKNPDPVDPGWPMMCDETGRDMVEPHGTCFWGEPRGGRPR